MTRIALAQPVDAGSNALPGAWRDVVAVLDVAFQPIVHMRSGRCHGFEALLRGTERAGYADPTALLDAAADAGVLAELDAVLRSMAIDRFRARDGWRRAKLFLNVDFRVATPLTRAMPGPDLTVNLDLGERFGANDDEAFTDAVERFRAAGCGVVLDGFGAGFAGLKRLYLAKPDYIKVDRFFIQSIARDPRRRTLAQHLVHLAHASGVLTVAVGVENDPDFYACRDLGFDFAQGFLLGQPEVSASDLPELSEAALRINRADRRRTPHSQRSLREAMDPLPALPVASPKTALLAYFSGEKAPAVAPVVDEHNRPLGLVRERDMKRFTYSRFGGELLRNKEVGHNLADLVTRAPVCEITTPFEQIIEAFSAEAANDGIVLIDGGEYVGFLSPGAILRLVHEHNLARAADQNPLTRLPGNAAIVRQIQAVLEDTGSEHVLVYFDFDNFKPFNDAYGFRQGDRAILMFADRLKALAANAGLFVAHIGGDDFFLAQSGVAADEVAPRLRALVEAFRSDAETLYDAETRDAGQLVGKDRDGNPKVFPLLSVSAVALSVPPGPHGLTLEDINAAFAVNKTEGKRNPDKVLFRSIGTT
jgi:diguanylate cyclase (GGDEF)-like protein